LNRLSKRRFDADRDGSFDGSTFENVKFRLVEYGVGVLELHFALCVNVVWFSTHEVALLKGVGAAQNIRAAHLMR